MAEKSISDDEYKFDHDRRGRAVVFCNQTFDPELELRDLSEAPKDLERLWPSLKVMGFVEDDIKVHKDLKFEEMMKIMEEVSKDDYKDCDCFLCVVISHGSYDYVQEGTEEYFIADFIYGTDKPGSLTLLMEKMQSCETLEGKPKIFIVDACRGNQRGKPVIKAELLDKQGSLPSRHGDAGLPRDIEASGGPQADTQKECFTDKEAVEPCAGSVGKEVGTRGRIIDHYQHGLFTGTWYSPDSECFPVWSHYLLIYSTQPGFEICAPEEGTPFMQAFHYHVMELKDTKISFLNLLTRVNNSVARSEWHDGERIWKQMPWVASRLAKDIVLSLKSNEHTQI